MDRPALTPPQPLGDDARRILDQALAAHPDNTLLVDTARRLGIR